MKTEFRPTQNRRSSTTAQTLVELLVTIALAGIVFAALAMLWTNGARGILAITNYTELDRRSKTALDIMSKDIRQAAGMTSFSTNSIALTNKAGVAFSYTYSTGAKTLTRTYNVSSKVILTGCDTLKFSISTRKPEAGFNFTSASNNVADAKLVDVNWKCSRQILGKSINTESIQTAKIVMRN